jgi:hypothetical protein
MNNLCGQSQATYQVATLLSDCHARARNDSSTQGGFVGIIQ